MDCRKTCYLLAIALIPLALAGCTLFGTSLPVVDPEEKYEAGPGPCTISGILTVQAPLLKLGSSREALDTYGTMLFDLDAHLYAVGGKDPAQFHYINDFQPWTTADPAGGTYIIYLNYSELPYGSYEIRIGRWWETSEVVTGNDGAEIVDVTRNVSVLTYGPIVLSESNEHASGCDLALNLVNGDYSLSGRILLDGWGDQVKQDKLILETSEPNGPGSPLSPARPEEVDYSWTIPVVAVDDGRLCYEITGLHEDFYFIVDGDFGTNLSQFGLSGFFLDESVPEREVTLAGFIQLPTAMHYLDTNTLEGRVYFTGLTSWTGDLVIEAAAVGGETGPGHQARQWISQDEIDDGWKLEDVKWDIDLNPSIELQGAVQLELGYLLPGEYELRAWMYGEEAGQRFAVPVGSGPFTVPSSEPPAGYQYDPAKLYPWQTNISTELLLEYSGDYRYLL